MSHNMPAPYNTTILIAGGSIAALTLANALSHLRIPYIVLEKAAEFAPQLGASIAISPNGFRILDQLGCYDATNALGADKTFKSLVTWDEEGRLVMKLDNVAKETTERLGYSSFFIDRRLVIKLLFDNIADKSGLLTNKTVSQVDQMEDGRVRVTTKEGSVFTADVLVGGDGFHSAVRREMWNMADRLSPGYFPHGERDSMVTPYYCIFGMSKPNKKFLAECTHNVMNHHHNYLLANAPDGRVYWALHMKMPASTYGYANVPRFSDKDRDAAATNHLDDHLGNGLTFRELYETRTMATLQALPHAVFEKWFYSRIVTIGDAAHKYNPLSGMGGNSAMEDAAVLANQLSKLIDPKTKTLDTSLSSLNSAFESYQAQRKPRAETINKFSGWQQGIQAMEGPKNRFIAKQVIPRMPPAQVLEIVMSLVKPAPRLNFIPIPDRPHYDSFYDERAAIPLSAQLTGKIRCFAYAAFTILAYMAYNGIGGAPTSPPLRDYMGAKLTMGIFSENSGSEAVTLNKTIIAFEHMSGWVDVDHTVHTAYTLAWLAPILLIWLVEGYRRGNKGSLIAWPAIFNFATNSLSLSVTIPLYCIASIWSTTSDSQLNRISRQLPESVARILIQALFIGYILPVLLILTPGLPNRSDLISSMRVLALATNLLVMALAKLTQKEDDVPREEKSKNVQTDNGKDAKHTFQAYRAIFFFSFLAHLLFMAYAFTSTNPSISLARLILPGQQDSFKHATEAWFTSLKLDLVLSVAAMVAFGLYNVFDLRAKGLITNKESGFATLVFVGVQCVMGSGAGLMGLWWWRETKIGTTGSAKV